MNPCTLFVKQSILIAIWIVASICYPTNYLLIIGLLVIISLNLSLLFYAVKIAHKREQLGIDEHKKMIEEIKNRVEIQSQEIENIKQKINPQEKSQDNQPKESDTKKQ